MEIYLPYNLRLYINMEKKFNVLYYGNNNNHTCYI